MFLKAVAKPMYIFPSRMTILKPILPLMHSETTTIYFRNQTFFTKKFKSSQVQTASNTFNIDKTRILINDVVNTFTVDKALQENEVLYEPFNHAYLIPHTDVLPEISKSMNHWMKLSEEDLKTVEEILHMVFEGLTLLDDVTDGSKLRRGLPTTHTIFGSERCVYTCISLILAAIKKVHVANRQRAIDVFNKNFHIYFSGLAQECAIKNSGTCPTRREYLTISIMKTGFFYNLCLDIMQAFSKCDKDFSTFSILLGLWLQIQNDNCNCSSDEFLNGKNFAEDISNGMYNYPIVLAIEKGTLESNILSNIMRQKTNSLELRKYCIDLMEKLGVLDESKATEALLFELTFNQISKLGGNPQLEKILENLNKWKVHELFPIHPYYNNIEKKRY